MFFFEAALVFVTCSGADVVPSSKVLLEYDSLRNNWGRCILSLFPSSSDFADPSFSRHPEADNLKASYLLHPTRASGSSNRRSHESAEARCEEE